MPGFYALGDFLSLPRRSSASGRRETAGTKRRRSRAALVVLAFTGTTLLEPEAAGRRADPVIVAAGDLCGSPTDCRPTARLIGRISPRRVLTLGDNAYPAGRLWQYRAYYRPNWGRFKAKTSPVPGNHDFHTPNARGYRDYFGARAPAFYYSYDVGAWHLIALSSDLGVSAGSPQERWLRRDLARHPRRCILAYWHHPRFTSGTVHNSDRRFDPFWRALYAARADVVLNGHVHNYERFARQSPSGHKTRKGIREFVVGTGGIGHYASGRPIKHSQVQNDTSFGVLKLRLHRRSYDWKFVPAAGGRFRDSGKTWCSRKPTTFRAAAATSSRTTGEAPPPLTLSYNRP
jgi:hypothetical protein